MSGDDREFGLEPAEEVRDLPRVVEEAYEVLGSYSWHLAAAGGVSVAAWVVVGLSGLWLSPVWLAVPALILLLLYFVPVTREPRLARDVLRRWDELRVERALESSGISGDPRLEVAESMADRIMRHPSVDERTRSATRAMVFRLRRLLHDLRRMSHLTRTQIADDRRDVSRSISDLQDLLDARVADILSKLADLHRTVVLRDTASLERVVSGVEDLARELEAEREVDRLLSSAERE